MDYIYGIISQKASEIEYTGITTSSASTTVSGTQISVNVLRPLPAVSASNNGQVLAVQSGQYVLAQDIGMQIPAFTQQDYGKVLKISNTGQLIWANPNE